MNSQVYYRKWRPRRFGDLVGQEAVARTLKQAIARNRIAHAYLFCGPRGTGKTSTARILAKAVNCLAPQEGEPCDQCAMCQAYNEGRAMDLVEIDAASNRGIDDIRSIREKVQYAPSEGKYKVYVLDEAHMLTAAAADAFLKTLEEPPAHVIFVLATTDPQGLVPTIISRCQRYDFRRVEQEAMAAMLARICDTEGIQAQPAALRSIARNADGSMRDAESLLEQAVTAFGSPLTQEQVRLLLGLTDDERVRQLVAEVLQGQVAQALTTLSAIAAEGVNLRQLHRQMADEVRDLLLVKAGAGQLLPQGAVAGDAASSLKNVPMERLVHTLRQLGQVKFNTDAPPTLALELAIIEAAQAPAVTQPQPAAVSAPPAEQRPPQEARPAPRQGPPQPAARPARPAPPSGPAPAPPPRQTTPAQTFAEAAATVSNGATPQERLDQLWDKMIATLNRQQWPGMNVGALLRACREHRLENGALYLQFTHQSHTDRMKNQMENPEARRRFLEAVTLAAGIPPGLQVEYITPNTPQRADRASRGPMVQAALGMGGRIIEETEEQDYDE
ncbi:MAG: DNA polymerase III subunit gamma/tau [Chloroflexi bacterium]|nr:DNA polymerase III subunit gamma/tau [Chloroflexota bacterium]